MTQVLWSESGDGTFYVLSFLSSTEAPGEIGRSLRLVDLDALEFLVDSVQDRRLSDQTRWVLVTVGEENYFWGLSPDGSRRSECGVTHPVLTDVLVFLVTGHPVPLSQRIGRDEDW